MKNLKVFIFAIIVLIISACKNTNIANFQASIVIDSNKELKEEKTALLDRSISTVNRGHHTFYYSNKDTFTNFDSYIFYFSPYIVEEKGINRRISLRIFAKTVSNQENIFDKVTIYDDKSNKLIIEFLDLKKEYHDDSFFISESGDKLLNLEEISVLEKMIDSEDIYLSFEKNSKKYNFLLNDTVRESFLNVIRKYKLLV